MDLRSFGILVMVSVVTFSTAGALYYAIFFGL
jgi:hypothetical protein